MLRDQPLEKRAANGGSPRAAGRPRYLGTPLAPVARGVESAERDQPLPSEDAFASSRVFQCLPAQARMQLAMAATPVTLAAGEECTRPGHAMRPLLILDGLVRVYIAASHGVQATAYYLRAGDTVGLFPAGAGHPQLRSEACRTTRALELPVEQLQPLARATPEFGLELERELLRRWGLTLAILGINTFGTVRDRVIHHVLSMQPGDAPGCPGAIDVTHQELADAAGTAREVVGRILRELRDASYIDLERGQVIVRNRSALEHELRLGFPDEARLLHPHHGRRTGTMLAAVPGRCPAGVRP